MSIWDLCDQYIAMEWKCFEPWRDLRGGRATADPEVVVASQDPLQAIAMELRRVCLTDPAAAEAWRQESIRDQVEGDIRLENGIRATRGKAGRDRLRGDWTRERIRIVERREALAVGLGWPHRGELVAVDAPRSSSGHTWPVRGPGVYLDSNDIYNVGHIVWVLEPGPRTVQTTLLVLWTPPKGGAQPDCAHPDGDIGIRVAGAKTRGLPVPLPRWPKPVHLSGGPRGESTIADGGQYELFGLWELDR